MSSGAIVQSRPTIGLSFSTLTISNAAVGLDSTKFLNSGGNANRAFLTLAEGQIRYRYDQGNDPTSTVGHLLDAGGFLLIEGTNQMNTIKFIRTTSTDAVASITFERE